MIPITESSRAGRLSHRLWRARHLRASVVAVALSASALLLAPRAQADPFEGLFSHGEAATLLDEAVPEGWASVEMDLEPAILERNWSGMPAGRRRSLVSQMEAGRSFVATDPSNNGVMSITVMLFDETTTAVEALADLQKMTRRHLTSGVLPELDPDAVTWGALAVPEASDSATVRFKVDLYDDEAAAQYLYTARVVRGRALVEFALINLDPDEEAISALIATLFDAVEVEG